MFGEAALECLPGGIWNTSVPDCVRGTLNHFSSNYAPETTACRIKIRPFLPVNPLLVLSGIFIELIIELLL